MAKKKMITGSLKAALGDCFSWKGLNSLLAWILPLALPDTCRYPSPFRHAIQHKYCIYSINRPGRLLNFWTLRAGAYSRWALIRGWAPFSASVVCLFCNKTINANNKTQRSNKARFLCKIVWRKLRPWGSLFSFNLIVTQVGGVGVGAYLSLIGRKRGWGGRLFEAGRLLTFSVFGMGAY